MKTNVHSVGYTAKSEELDFAEKKVTKLLRFDDEIQSADVTLRKDNSVEVRYVAEIRLAMKGDELFASKSGNSLHEAIDESTDALRGQLVKRKEKTRE